MANGFQYIASTVLFVDSHPIGYKIYQSNNEFRLEPSDIPDDSILPPFLFVHHLPGISTVHGTTNQDLIDQVLEDISSIGNTHTNKKAAPLRTAFT